MRKDEFARRRRRLMKMMGKGGIAILPAVPEKSRNNDVLYHYRPDSDFFYLTGFAEPEAVAVLVPGRAQAEYVLFVRDRDPARETWDGRRAGPDGATREYGADDAFPDQRYRRHPAGADGELRARLLHHGSAPGVRSACDRLGERLEVAGAHRRASAAGIHCAGSSAARHASVQIAAGARRHASGRAHRRVGAQARHAVRPSGTHGIRGDGRVAARIPAQQRRHVLPPDRRRRGERVHPALSREFGSAEGGRSAVDRRRLRV